VGREKTTIKEAGKLREKVFLPEKNDPRKEERAPMW